MSSANGWVDACPNCDGTHYREQATGKTTYKCVCGETFDEPHRRWNKSMTPPWERDEETGLPLDAVRDAIAARDLSHVSTRMIADDIEADRTTIGQTLVALGEQGALRKWRRTTDRIKWTVVDVEGDA